VGKRWRELAQEFTNWLASKPWEDDSVKVSTTLSMRLNVDDAELTTPAPEKAKRKKRRRK
jgi:hypothetical protein